MSSLVLPFAALVVALASSLTWRVAPPWRWAWKATIAVTEFGHWFVFLPLGLACIAWKTGESPGREIALILSGASIVLLLRPMFLATRVAARLPAELERAFGSRMARRGVPVASWRRLFWRARLRLIVPTTERFTTQGGEQLPLDFYPANSDVPAPCLVVVHGGGWDGGDRTQLAEWNSHWAGLGYAVAAVSYRLAPKHPWPAQREDLAAAIDFLKANAARLKIDATRLVLVGRSAGGQIATAFAYGARDTAIRAVVSFYAPFDMEFAWSVSREDDALNSCQLMRQYLGGPPDTPERRERYASASAQLMVRPGTPPTLLLHGDPDTLVWVRHSERLAARLSEVGVPHVFVRMAWATHGFDFNLHGPGGQIADFAIRRFLEATTARGSDGD